MLNAVLALGLHFLAGALFVQSPTVEVEFDRDRDFTEYETYAWSRSQVPADSMADHVRITKAIADKLEEIELSPETSGRMYVFGTGWRARTRSCTWTEPRGDPRGIRPTVRLGDHKEMLLIVEMFDAKTDALVWRAQCSHRKPSPDTAAKSIQETVERLFEKYPTMLK